MKIKSLFAILLVITLLACIFVIPTNAKELTQDTTNIEIIILDEVSTETKAKIERYFASDNESNDNVSTYGITCTLLGHKLENATVVTVTHKVRSTAPRCKEETYTYQSCTRCDYEKATLVDTEYIVCCS